jgi:hypothetical protein
MDVPLMGIDVSRLAAQQLYDDRSPFVVTPLVSEVAGKGQHLFAADRPLSSSSRCWREDGEKNSR